MNTDSASIDMVMLQGQSLVILGGGLAGLSLSIQLKQRLPELSVSVIERASHPVTEAAHKVGESLVELSTHYFAEVLGLKEHMVSAQLPKLGLRFFFRPSPDQPPEERLVNTVEFGAKAFPDAPSYQIDRGIFENFLGEHARELGVNFIDGAKVTSVVLNKKSINHDVHYTQLSNGEENTINCRWVVDACSRQSPIKRQKSLNKPNEHGVSSAWFRIGDKLDISDIHAGTSLNRLHEGDNSRWFSTNHFMGEGYWLWFIPLSSGSTSIGIVVENEAHPLELINTFEKSMAWLRQHEPLAAEFIATKADLLQDFRVLRNFSHDCKKVYSRDRWFLTGEAGVFLDPFYSPGSDFIAISNTFICHLIEEDLKSPMDFEVSCAMLDLFYLNLFKNTSLVYQNLYPVFSHPVVMPVKILWDFSVYWSFTAFLYMQGKFDSAQSLFKLHRDFEDLGAMNKHLQQLLALWAKKQPKQAKSIYIDPFDIDFLRDLNVGLTEQFDDEAAFKEKFLSNVDRLKNLYQQICFTVYERYPELEDEIEASDALSEDVPQYPEVQAINEILERLTA